MKIEILKRMFVNLKLLNSGTFIFWSICIEKTIIIYDIVIEIIIFDEIWYVDLKKKNELNVSSLLFMTRLEGFEVFDDTIIAMFHINNSVAYTVLDDMTIINKLISLFIIALDDLCLLIKWWSSILWLLFFLSSSDLKLRLRLVSSVSSLFSSA